MINLGLVKMSVVRYAKTVKRVPKSWRGGASRKHGPKGPLGPEGPKGPAGPKGPELTSLGPYNPNGYITDWGTHRMTSFSFVVL